MAATVDRTGPRVASANVTAAIRGGRGRSIEKAAVPAVLYRVDEAAETFTLTFIDIRTDPVRAVRSVSSTSIGSSRTSVAAPGARSSTSAPSNPNPGSHPTSILPPAAPSPAGSSRGSGRAPTCRSGGPLTRRSTPRRTPTDGPSGLARTRRVGPGTSTPRRGNRYPPGTRLSTASTRKSTPSRSTCCHAAPDRHQGLAFSRCKGKDNRSVSVGRGVT